MSLHIYPIPYRIEFKCIFKSKASANRTENALNFHKYTQHSSYLRDDGQQYHTISSRYGCFPSILQRYSSMKDYLIKNPALLALYILSYLLRTSSSKLKIVETITIIQQMPFLMLPVGFLFRIVNSMTQLIISSTMLHQVLLSISLYFRFSSV